MTKPRNHYWPCFVFALLALSAGIAHADGQPSFKKVQVPVGHIFIPSEGYDDNDNIQFVIDGVLPNGCYRVDHEQTDTASASENHIAVSLIALLRTDGPCANQMHLPQSLLAAV